MSTNSKLSIDDCPRPLRVAIVGAGIGGLSAAIGLRRNGHAVDLYDQSQFAAEIGAAVHLMPNGLSILRQWELDPADFDANPMSRAVEYDQHGRLAKDMDLSKANLRWSDPWLLAQRAKFHNALKTKALAMGAVLHTSTRVVGVDTAGGTITLGDGRIISADVILGADGVYSVTRTYITDAKPFGSGKSAFRFMIPRKVALADPETGPLAEMHDSLLAWMGKTHRIIMYSCSNNEMLNFVCMHPEEESRSMIEEGWNAQVTTEQVLQVYRDFPRAVISLLAKSDAPGTPKGVWPLLDMEQIPWTKGIMALLGDAAHPFTPHQGQGAVQALEDAASLSVVLPAGTHPAAVPERLRLYERIRSKRAHTIQAYSREAGKDVAEGEKPEVNNTDELFSHDELYYSKRMFNRWKHEQDPTNFRFLPLAAGAFSGMRRVSPSRDSSRFKRVTVKFKTSKPFMETLLPNDHFVFRRPDTVCTASLVTTSLSNLPWLGGEGYTTLALHIHGVQYKQKNGGVMNGSFVAIHLVSRGEAVAACREDLGLPAVPCDLDVYQPDDNSCTVTASWEGAKFASVSLTGLVAKDAALERGPIGTLADYGVMSYRYVPAVGRPGEPEAEYACVTPHAREKTETVGSVSSSTSARLVFKDLGWEQLPTLGHIAAAFSQMPIYGIAGVKVVEGSNPSEQLSSRKID